MDFSRRDLAALNIMRGRDNGLPDYNTVRRAMGLKEQSWSELVQNLPPNRKQQMETELRKLYSDRLDIIDLYVGGMLESNGKEGRPGPLFRRIIKEQFERIRDSDRFWFENKQNSIFTEAEIEEIRKIRLWDILVNSTRIPSKSIQRQVFQFQRGDPCPQPSQLNSSLLEPCVILAGWDYFHGSEVPYICVCILLILIPAGKLTLNCDVYHV